MKNINKILFGLLIGISFIGVSNAASLKVTANKSTVVVGNNVTVTVSASGAAGWEYCLNYDKSVFSFVSSTADSGECQKTGSTLIGGSKVTFTLKAKKSGSSTVGLSAAQMYDDGGNAISSTKGSVSLTAKTQAEIEASYSTNANLSSLSVEGYELNPTFSVDKLEYELTVPNDIEKVNVIAQKADGSASVKGAGEIELSEGSNKVEVVVTAQKGNTKTYTLNITRQELNPIYVTLDGKQYSVVRKADSLTIPSYYSSSTITIDDNEVPCFESEITGFTLVGLKDEEGNIALYIYNSDGTFKLYQDFTTEGITFISMDTDEVLKGYEEVEIEINEKKIKAYKLVTGESDFVVVYGMNAKTGEKGWYQYDLREGTFQRNQTNLIVNLQDDARDYLLLVICFASGLGLSIIAIISLLILGNKRKKKIVKLLAVMENGKYVNKEYIVEENEDAEVDSKEVVDKLNELHDDVPEVRPDQEKFSATIELKDLDDSEEDIEDNSVNVDEDDDNDETEEVPVMLDDDDVGGYNVTQEIEKVEDSQLSKRELRKLEKQREKEEKMKLAKAQREFLYDSYTSTSVFDTFKEEPEDETPKRRGRPKKK